MIMACEPVGSVVQGILCDGRLTELKQFTTSNVSCNVALMFESLFPFHPNLFHIGIRTSVISSSDMVGLCKYLSSRSQSGSSELTLYLSQNVFENESLHFTD